MSAVGELGVDGVDKQRCCQSDQLRGNTFLGTFSTHESRASERKRPFCPSTIPIERRRITDNYSQPTRIIRAPRNWGYRLLDKKQAVSTRGKRRKAKQACAFRPRHTASEATNLERWHEHKRTARHDFSSCVAIFKVALSYRIAGEDPSKALPVTVSVGVEVPAVPTTKPLVPVTVLSVNYCADHSNGRITRVQGARAVGYEGRNGARPAQNSALRRWK